jgi:uncharacterized protein (TIGR00369 family)
MGDVSHPDHFGLHLGYRLVAPKAGNRLPSSEMTIEEKHLSSAGVSHGGAVLSFMDFAAGAGLFFVFEDRQTRCSTVDMNVHFLRPVPLGTKLTAIPKLLHLGKSLARVSIDVLNQDDDLLAHGTAAFNIYRSKKPKP